MEWVERIKHLNLRGLRAQGIVSADAFKHELTLLTRCNVVLAADDAELQVIDFTPS